MARRLTKEMLSQETIAYQSDRGLFRALTNILSRFMLDTMSEETVQKKLLADIEKATKKYTGLNVVLVMLGDPDGPLNLCIGTPFLNGRSPLLEARKPLIGKVVGPFPVAELKEIDAVMEGLVDLRKGKVSGVFEKIPSNIYMSLSLFTPRGIMTVTAEELAAGLLHELGHLFAYFEMLATTVLTNYALDHVVKALHKTHDLPVRIKLIEAAAEDLEATEVDAASLAKQTDDVVIQSVLLNASVEASRTATGARTYEYRAFEAVADQFATQQGAGKALASMVRKFTILLGSTYKDKLRQTVIGLVLIVFLTVLQTSIAIAGITTYAILLALPNLDNQLYDPPKDRLIRIKRMLVQDLKDPAMSDILRHQLLDDIRAIDEMITITKNTENSPIFMAIWRKLTAGRRHEVRAMEFQKHLEAMAANDLFEAGHRLALL